MARNKTGNTELVQFRTTTEQVALLRKMAESQNTTLAELMRRTVRMMTRNALWLADDDAA
jgi:hypothetical protein